MTVAFADKYGFRPRGARVYRYQDCCCSDPGCKKGHGSSCDKKGVVKVFRIDYALDGSPEEFFMCHTCADDSCDSGAFFRLRGCDPVNPGAWLEARAQRHASTPWTSCPASMAERRNA